MPDFLSTEGIVQRSFDEDNSMLRLLHVEGEANPFTANADLSIQSILQRVYDDTTGALRTVSIGA